MIPFPLAVGSAERGYADEVVVLAEPAEEDAVAVAVVELDKDDLAVVVVIRRVEEDVDVGEGAIVLELVTTFALLI